MPSKTQSIPVTRKVNFHLITLFPESCFSYINESIIARAQKEGRLSINFYNPRDFVKLTAAQKKAIKLKHKIAQGSEVTECNGGQNNKPYLRVDDKPYGGGPGMVMEAMPIIAAIESAIKVAEKKAAKEGMKKSPKISKVDMKNGSKNDQVSRKPKIKVIFLSPGGEQFTNELATKWIKGKQSASSTITDFIIICGRYEGVDERVNTIFKSEKISVGPFVTTGGELPALLMIDVMARQIEGVLGNFDSREEARIASHAVYTRPEVLEYKGKKYKVPPVLMSGDHKKIEEWRGEGKIGDK